MGQCVLARCLRDRVNRTDTSLGPPSSRQRGREKSLGTS